MNKPKPQSSLVTQTSSLVRSAAHGARSIMKTELLRADRTSPQQYEQRLAICRQCPGGHATFRKDGSLHTCGPILQSMKEAGLKTCGCVLSRKARDAKEACPFGYWPMSDPAQVRPQVSLPLLNANAGKLVLPSGEVYDPGRRRFLGGAVAAVGMMIAPGYLWARDPEEAQKCWFEVEPCEGGDNCWIQCTKVQGHKLGEAFRANDNKCYRVLSNHVEEEPEDNKLTSADFSDANCDECETYQLTDCEGVEDDIITSTDLSAYDGKIVKLSGSDTCWKVRYCVTDCTVTQESISVANDFDDCYACFGCENAVKAYSCCFSEDSVIDLITKLYYYTGGSRWLGDMREATGMTRLGTSSVWEGSVRLRRWNDDGSLDQDIRICMQVACVSAGVWRAQAKNADCGDPGSWGGWGIPFHVACDNVIQNNCDGFEGYDTGSDGYNYDIKATVRHNGCCCEDPCADISDCITGKSNSDGSCSAST